MLASAPCQMLAGRAPPFQVRMAQAAECGEGKVCLRIRCVSAMTERMLSMKTTAWLATCLLSTCTLASHADGPALQEVVRDPASYADQKLEFKAVTLSGDITKYEVAGIRNYYLTVSARNVIAPGFSSLRKVWRTGWATR